MSAPSLTPVLNFINPTPEMLMRDGERPISAVVATVPNHSELVTTALHQLNSALELHMAPSEIVLMLQDHIQLTNGRVIELGPHSVFFSLSYPTALSRIFEMELGPPAGATIH